MHIDQADFTDWMSFLPSNLMDEIIPNPEKPSSQITRTLNQHVLIEKKNYIGINALGISALKLIVEHA